MLGVVGEGGSYGDDGVLNFMCQRILYLSILYISFHFISFHFIMANQYRYVFSDESIEWLVSRPEVVGAKARIQSKITTSTTSSMSEYFTLPLTSTIRSELFEAMGFSYQPTSHQYLCDGLREIHRHITTMVLPPFQILI